MSNEDEEHTNPYKYLVVDIKEDDGIAITIVSERWLLSDKEDKKYKNVLVYPKLKGNKMVNAVRKHVTPPKTKAEFLKSKTEWKLYEYKFRQVFGEKFTYFIVIFSILP